MLKCFVIVPPPELKKYLKRNYLLTEKNDFQLSF